MSAQPVVTTDPDYKPHATTTGTLDECLRCGALVGNRNTHDRWHDGDREAIRVQRALLKMKRSSGNLPLGLS